MRLRAVDLADPRITDAGLRAVRWQARRLWRGRVRLQLDWDDLVHAGLVGLLRAAARYRPGARALPGWAASAIRGEMVDAIRAAAHRMASLDDAPPPAWPRHADEHPDAGRIAAALGRLGPGQRAILEALYFRPDEPAAADLAAELGRDPGTVRGQHHHALRRLRGRLAPP